MVRGTGAVVLREEIRNALGRGASVVTANERAARHLRRDWDEGLRQAGSDRWEAATVMSWSAWTASLWRDLLLGGRTQAMLLNAFQEHAVWRAILVAEPDATGLRGIDSLAGMAMEAWARVCAYAEPQTIRGQTVSRLRRDGGSRDTAAFAGWARAFERRCEIEGLISAAEVDSVLAEAIRTRELRPDIREVLLVGFDHLTPARERLVSELRAARVTVLTLGRGAPPTRSVLTSAVDETEELRACARWVASALGRNPSARIAVVAPDPAAERAGLERVFREVLAPELEWIGGSEAAAPYEFSLGRPLAESPMIAVALELLRWTSGALPLERVSRLVLSDYFAGAGAERGARAAFDAFELRKLGLLRPEVTASGLARRLAGSRRSKSLPRLLGAVRRFAGRGAEMDGVSQGYGLWAQGMRGLLKEAEWGPAGAETSEEYQVRRRCESALDALSTLDFEARTVDYAEALRAIERISAEMVLAPESRSAPVQVVGPMEAAGSEFDMVWLIRAGETTWPLKTRSLPLLGWSYQRELGMPGTDAARDLELARTVTERLLASGREVVVSYAQRSGEARQRASALVRDLGQKLGLEEVALEELAGREPERVPVRLERVEDTGCRTALGDGPVAGGVRVLQSQVACGFRAFAEHRLWSTELERPDLGLDARESGSAVHRALEFFWSEVNTQSALLGMSDGELQATLSRAIEEGLRKAGAQSGGSWDEAYLSTQRVRLRRLLNSWLEMEKQRPAFAVQQREQAMRDVRIGPLRMTLRVDRVDIVDEARVLIDYKTGAANLEDWRGERPDSPQVPLYAILTAGSEEERGHGPDEASAVELGAVAFGAVRAGREMGLKGFAAREGLLPGKLSQMEADTFAGQVDRWREVLERLATEFAEGDAPVRPKIYPGTCKRCSQRILCRLDASLLEEIDEVEAEKETDG